MLEKNIFKNGNQVTKLHWLEVEVAVPAQNIITFTIFVLNNVYECKAFQNLCTLSAPAQLFLFYKVLS